MPSRWWISQCCCCRACAHDQYNTTIYGMDDRYRGIKGQRNVVFMNEADARQLGFAEGDRVDMAAICNDGRERCVTGFVVVIYQIPRGNIAAYYPETNPLVPIDSIGRACLPRPPSPSRCW